MEQESRRASQGEYNDKKDGKRDVLREDNALLAFPTEAGYG